jgi:hypothetical protein
MRPDKAGLGKMGLRGFALIAVVLAAPPAAQGVIPVAAPPPHIDYAAERAVIGRYQDADQHLQDVGWRLAQANAPF